MREKLSFLQISARIDQLLQPPGFHKNCSILTKLRSLRNYTTRLSKNTLFIFFCYILLELFKFKTGTLLGHLYIHFLTVLVLIKTKLFVFRDSHQSTILCFILNLHQKASICIYIQPCYSKQSLRTTGFKTVIKNV